MEEKIPVITKHKYNSKSYLDLAEQFQSPKCLASSKLKAMSGKIFWFRNNSQSVIERVRSKEKENSIDKLKQVKGQQQQSYKKMPHLLNKLSLPRLKQSGSIYEISPCQEISHSLMGKHKKQQLFSLIQRENGPAANETHEAKEHLHRQRQTAKGTIQSYKARCDEEIESFSLETTLGAYEKKLEGESKKKIVKKVPETIMITCQEQNWHLPSNLKKYLVRGPR